jgi:hypothetical protein
MKTHANARLSLKGRELLVDRIEDATAPRANGLPGIGPRDVMGCVTAAPLPGQSRTAPTSAASN